MENLLNLRYFIEVTPSSAPYILAPALRNSLFVQARKFFDNDEASEDAVQETLLRLWMVKDRIEGGKEGVNKLALRILKNYCVSQWRKQKQAELFSQWETHTQAEATHLSGETLAECDETHARLRAALATLPDGERRVFIMKQMEEAENAEVAQTLGIKEHTVQTLLARARRRLAERLGLKVPKPRRKPTLENPESEKALL